MFCRPYTWSALSPKKATDDMTEEVGQRDGRLYISTHGRLPVAEETDYDKLLTLDNKGNPIWTNDVGIINKLKQEKQNEIITEMATIEAGQWADNRQSVTVPNVTRDNIVIVSPAPSGYIQYAQNQVRATQQGISTLIFECETRPTENIPINIVIFNQNLVEVAP